MVTKRSHLHNQTCSFLNVVFDVVPDVFLTLNGFHTLLQCFHYWLWTSKYRQVNAHIWRGQSKVNNYTKKELSKAASTKPETPTTNSKHLQGTNKNIFKFSSRNTKKRCETCSKLTLKAAGWCQMTILTIMIGVEVNLDSLKCLIG